jgi:hypothetical protein
MAKLTVAARLGDANDLAGRFNADNDDDAGAVYALIDISLLGATEKAFGEFQSRCAATFDGYRERIAELRSKLP